MAITGELRDGVARDAQVHPFSRVPQRPCARPSCTTPAVATLTFRYATREAWIERLADVTDPQAYDLCVTHAARTRPPEGWQLRDRRPEGERRPVVPHTTPVDLGGDRTVAVLAAALRSVPDPVSEDAVADHAEVDRAVALSGGLVPDELDAATQADEAEEADGTIAAGGSPPDGTPSPSDDRQLALMPADALADAGTLEPRPPLVVRDRDALASVDVP